MEDAELIADSPRLKESNQELLKILGEVLGCLMIMGLTGRARPTRNGLTTWRTPIKKHQVGEQMTNDGTTALQDERKRRLHWVASLLGDSVENVMLAPQVEPVEPGPASVRHRQGSRVLHLPDVRTEGFCLRAARPYGWLPEKAGRKWRDGIATCAGRNLSGVYEI